MTVTYASKVDANQRDIVAALRQAGATVQHLHAVGKGCPDLLVGFRMRNYLLEVKTETGELTGDQVHWFSKWNGQCSVVRTVDQALKTIGAI